MKRIAALALGAVLFGCIGHHRLERVQALTPEGKALFSKYRQFMTEVQIDRFLALQEDEEREAFVSELKVEERLARYPQYIQDAIWAREVVPGMDHEAVLLSWGLPELREIDEKELEKGNNLERWNYQREGRFAQVIFASNIVTTVDWLEGT